MTDIPADHLITVDEAIVTLDAVPLTLRRETIDLNDADSRTLADPITADRDAPAFDKSLVDGYALRSVDSSNATRRDIGEIAAGGQLNRTLAAGECVAIMTGAPLPPGADAVCPIESTSADGDSISFSEAIVPGRFIEPRAAHWRRGDILLPAGTLLGPAGLSVAASVGMSKVAVFARPRVGVLTTGDEIVPVDQTPGPSQLRNSNAILITSLLRRLGCEPIALGHAIDDPAAIKKLMQTPGLDAICVTGGMSMGRHDYVPNVMRDSGYSFAITKLRMRPGKPFVLGLVQTESGQVDSKKAPVIFGLPGNPLSGFVCVARLASRLLLRMQARSPEPEWQRATSIELPANGPREFYQPAVLENGTIQPLPWRGSADVLTLARANVLIRRLADAPAVAAGDVIAVMRLP